MEGGRSCAASAAVGWGRSISRATGIRRAARSRSRFSAPVSPIPPPSKGFAASSESLARLRHPHLAEVFDFRRVEDSGLPFLTMEYVEGHDLGELRRKEALARFDDLVAQWPARARLHPRARLADNDINPHNIRVTPAFQVKLLDFGLAQRLAAGSEAGASGTLQYLAPERLAGTPPDARSTSTRSASSSTRCSPAAVPTTRRPRAAW